MKHILLALPLLFIGLTNAEAARCPQGKVLYRSAGACISKTKAIQIGIYRPRAVAKKKMKRVPRAPVRRTMVAEPIRVLKCDSICELKIALPKWVERNREDYE